MIQCHDDLVIGSLSHHHCMWLPKHSQRLSVRVIFWIKKIQFQMKDLDWLSSIWDWVVQTAATGRTACSFGWKDRVRERNRLRMQEKRVPESSLEDLTMSHNQIDPTSCLLHWPSHGNVSFDELTQKDGQHLRVRHMFLTLACACKPSLSLRQHLSRILAGNQNRLAPKSSSL